jgi:hypothetical protein
VANALYFTFSTIAQALAAAMAIIAAFAMYRLKAVKSAVFLVALLLVGCNGGANRDKTYTCTGDVYLMPSNQPESPPDFRVGVRITPAEIQVNEALPFFAPRIPLCRDKGDEYWNGNADQPYFSTTCGHHEDPLPVPRSSATFAFLTNRLSLYHAAALYADAATLECSPTKNGN